MWNVDICEHVLPPVRLISSPSTVPHLQQEKWKELEHVKNHFRSKYIECKLKRTVARPQDRKKGCTLTKINGSGWIESEMAKAG